VELEATLARSTVAADYIPNSMHLLFEHISGDTVTRYKKFRQYFKTPRVFPGKPVTLSLNSMSKVLSCLT